jgi:hypothetical protein
MAKAATDIRSLARSHTDKALKVLVGIMNQPDAQPAARVAAANSLLDRGWGKATQTIEATVTNVDPSRISDGDLAAIVSIDGGSGTHPAPINPEKLN